MEREEGWSTSWNNNIKQPAWRWSTLFIISQYRLEQQHQAASLVVVDPLHISQHRLEQQHQAASLVVVDPLHISQHRLEQQHQAASLEVVEHNNNREEVSFLLSLNNTKQETMRRLGFARGGLGGVYNSARRSQRMLEEKELQK